VLGRELFLVSRYVSRRPRGRGSRDETRIRNNGRDRDSGSARAREISQEFAAREGPEGRRSAFDGGPAVDDCDEQQNVDRNYAVINLETRARADTRSYAHTGRPPAGFTGGWGFLYLAVGTVRRLHVYTHCLAALYACLR